MPIMEWDDSLDVGVPTMNREHQGLLNIMNRLFDAVERGEEGPKVIAMVDELGKATVSHFASKERYFDSIGFPDAAVHKAIHKKLLTQFGESAAEIKANNGKVSRKFFDFLRYWLSAHIRGIDVKYGAHSASARKTG